MFFVEFRLNQSISSHCCCCCCLLCFFFKTVRSFAFRIRMCVECIEPRKHMSTSCHAFYTWIQKWPPPFEAFMWPVHSGDSVNELVNYQGMDWATSFLQFRMCCVKNAITLRIHGNALIINVKIKLLIFWSVRWLFWCLHNLHDSYTAPH